MGTMLKRNDCDTKACLLMYIRLRYLCHGEVRCTNPCKTEIERVFFRQY
jgi:hypothetical protein